MSKKSNIKNVSLKAYNKMFIPNDDQREDIPSGITEIPLTNLHPFKNHPFKLYDGERLKDMIESVKTNGVIIPIIVRPIEMDALSKQSIIESEIYEILSGHNRVEAAKSAGFETVPAIIKENLSEDEALLIVTETNLIQRSFSDLSHSERAASLAVHHEAIKIQGKRTDLINDIENLLKSNGNVSNDADSATSAHIVRKLEAREKTAQNYGLNRGTVARYLRINTLINSLKQLIDNNKIPLLAAVELSYVSEQNQHDLFDLLNQNENFKIDIKKAGLLREFSANNKLPPETINGILSGAISAVKKKNRTPLPVQSLKIKGKVLSMYFRPEQKPAEIEAELFDALKFYREHKK